MHRTITILVCVLLLVCFAATPLASVWAADPGNTVSTGSEEERAKRDGSGGTDGHESDTTNPSLLDRFKEGLDDIKNGVGDAWDSTKEWVGDAWDSTKEWVGDAWNSTTTWFGDAWNSAKNLYENNFWFRWSVNITVGVIAAVACVLAAKFIVGAFALKAAAKGLVMLIGWGAAKGAAFSGLGNLLRELLGGEPKGFMEYLGDLGLGALIGGITAGIGSKLMGWLKGFPGLFTAIKASKFSRYVVTFTVTAGLGYAEAYVSNGGSPPSPEQMAVILFAAFFATVTGKADTHSVNFLTPDHSVRGIVTDVVGEVGEAGIETAAGRAR